MYFVIIFLIVFYLIKIIELKNNMSRLFISHIYHFSPFSILHSFNSNCGTLYLCPRQKSHAYLQVKGSTVGQTHPVEEVYPAHSNIAADAARKGKPSVDNCALLLTSDDWLRSLADMRDRPGIADYRFRCEYINYGKNLLPLILVQPPSSSRWYR